MIKVDDIHVYNFESAIHGMRSPYNSYDKSDSVFHGDFVIGEKDLSLMQRLFKAGTEHRKFMRQILVSMDITAPLYWWKQADCYTVGVTKNSQSTMHTIAKKELTLSDFSFDNEDGNQISEDSMMGVIAQGVIQELNVIRKEYLEFKNKDTWRFLIQLLPESYNQTRTITMNYEVVANIIRQRRHHKLCEWDNLIAIFLEELPYLKEIMGENGNE